MSGFALNIDLSLYFEDLRKYASIYIDSDKFKQVREVEKHIKTMFKIEDNICLINNKKFLIPSDETISILQKYETLKVQKCDFYDHQIHYKKKSSNCEQSALNLIRPDKTIDLSCKPKQRFQSNPSRNHSIVVDSSKCNIENSSALESLNIVKSKNKTKSNCVAEISYDGVTNVLDMSLNKPAKKMKSIYVDALDDEARKTKKKKNCFEDEEFDLSSSYKNSFSHKKKKHKSKHRSSEFEGEIINNSCKQQSCRQEISPHLCQFNEEFIHRIKNKGLKAKKYLEDYKKDIVNKVDMLLNSSSIVNHVELSLRNKTDSIKCDKGNGHSELNDQQLVKYDEANGHSELNDQQSVKYDEATGHRELNDRQLVKYDEANGDIELNDQQSVKYDERYGELNDQQSVKYDEGNGNLKLNGEQSVNENHSLQNPSDCTDNNKMGTRRRIRKHNKKKKAEKRALMQAVGPVLPRVPEIIASSPNQFNSPKSKHLFFTYEDFEEEMEIPSTPKNVIETTLPCTESLKDVACSKEDVTLPSEDKRAIPSSAGFTNTWQTELRKLPALTGKPQVFCRSSSVASLKPNLVVSSMEVDIKNTNTKYNLESTTDFREKDLENGTVDENLPNGLEGNSTSNIEEKEGEDKLKTNLFKEQSITHNLINTILTSYPVVEKVVKGDHILFKILKLSEETQQPECSNAIVAKVINAFDFPNKISLEIVHGVEEFDTIINVIHGSYYKDLRWTEIIEPRLFYP